MGALQNASVLRLDSTFNLWIEAACVYVARLVIMESPTVPDHTARLNLAREAATGPASVAPLMVAAVACDPDVAAKGNTATIVGEQMIIDKVSAAWTIIALLKYPNS